MLNTTSPAISLPPAVEARVARRVAYWQSPEHDPEGDCSDAVAEIMAIQEEGQALLRKLEMRLEAAASPQAARELYRALASLL